jgi:acyl-CoA synthetase (AMP-forming)/AMP-acid ligase II
MIDSINTIAKLLEAGAADHAAVSAPGGVALSYGGLRLLVTDTVMSLRTRGIEPNDRVAYVLDNGPEAATTFLAVAAGATAAPLNPAYRADEYEFYLSDLRAKLLIVAQGKDSPSIAIAAKLGVPVARLIASPEKGAGTFTLEFSGGASPSGPDGAGFASPDDVALVLHTSGTTSRPKIVPLTHRNVCASARNVSETLALTPNDRNLSIMPLFHIHGLIASLVAPLSAGSEVCCSPGFNALKFFGWMAEVKPTWYTAVPTMHQAILARASKNADVVAGSRLRFIRSSSSALPPTVIAELERVFRAPVVEAYGMTEAAHQMASNPLPPRTRKPGTVGPNAGPEVRIVDERGNTAPPGMTGEIVIRGENVTRGYENNPSANETAFIDGWFRTGDQGTMDADGYVSITGRLKEIINRGGEKISPREVDEIIMEHPAVHQCVTFGMPHEMLGEEVAAAIVLKEGAACDDRELRQFASVRLADFKVPKKILILKEIPVGATGKLQRIGLAQKLGLG